MRRALASASRHIFLILVCAASVYPIWFTLQTALKTNAEYMLDPVGMPSAPTLHNFSRMFFHLPIPHWMLNSAIVTLSSVAMSTAVAMLSSYAIVFGRFRGRELLLKSSLALMVVPPVTLLLPMFILMVDAGLINTLTSVIIFYSGLLVPFSVFFLTNFYRTVPAELVEAATIDGAPPFAILRRIVAPMSAAASFTLVVVNFIYVWNELLIALVFLQDESKRTLMSGLTIFQGRYASNEPLVLAGAFLSMVPILLLYLSGQRFFVRGLTAGIGK